MALKRIIKLKEGIKEAKARDFKKINTQVEHIKKEISTIEREAEEVNEKLKTVFSEGLIFQYRALMARKKELMEKLHELELIREKKREELKQAYRDLKALDILRINKEREDMIKSLNLEFQRAGFTHLVRQRFRNG